MKQKRRDAFSLVEVVVALGILTFAGLALVGLLGAGIRGDHDSREQMQAATLAESMCATLRAAPTANFTTNAGGYYCLPGLTTAASNLSAATNLVLTWDGTLTTLSSGNARFGLLYNIVPPTNYLPSVSPGAAMVYLCLYWPPQASPTNAATGRFELTTSFYLP